MIFVHSINGQFSELKAFTQLHLPAINSELTWEKEMQGSLDERHQFNLFLITDTKEYIGAYRFKNDETIHLIEGEMGSDQILFYEYDQEMKVSATISGVFNNFTFYGTWTDKNRMEEFSFIAYDRQANVDDEMKNEWVKSFRNEHHHLLFLKQRDEYVCHGQYNGFPFESIVECLNLSCSEFIIYLDGKTIHEPLTLKVTINENAATINNKQIEQIEKLELVRHIDFYVHNNYSDSRKTYRVFPTFQHSRLFTLWNDMVQKYISIDESFDQISSYESNLDVVVDYLDHRYFSGTIIYQNNQSSQIQEEGFFIDFKRNKIRTNVDFIPKVNLVKQQIENVVKENKSHTHFKASDYQIYSIGINGLIARTPKHILYGQDKIVIPHGELSKQIIR